MDWKYGRYWLIEDARERRLQVSRHLTEVSEAELEIFSMHGYLSEQYNVIHRYYLTVLTDFTTEAKMLGRQ